MTKRFLLLLVLVAAVASVADAKRSVTELPEVLVESPKRNMLHVMAYVREYSNLTTYSDTVTLFREKMVDFMLPANKKSGYKGWKIPRVIKSESYYRFTNAYGLDSVSDTSRHHFSWSDWMGLPPNAILPQTLMDTSAATDTVHGKYSPIEIWNKKEDVVTLEVNVLADTIGRRWVPYLGAFFRDGNVEFEDFKMCMHYENVLGNDLLQRDLSKYTFHVDASGRGHSMFRFNTRYEGYYATTDGEMYILDMEYITEREAKKWAKGKYDDDRVGLIRAADAPRLSDETLALIDRVEHIDNTAIRLNDEPDANLKRMERNRSKGGEALRYLKNITGISDANAKRKHRKNWQNFRDNLKKK